jgi:hypothetical protein
MLGFQLFVKMTHVEIEIPVAVKSQHFSITVTGTRLGNSNILIERGI